MDDRGLVRLVVLVVIIALTVRQAAGRLTPKVMIAPILFLLSRGPVLVVWLLGTVGWMYVLTTGAIERGRDPLEEFSTMAGLSAFLGIGVAALVVGPIFMVMRALAPALSFELEPGEVVERTIVANHFLRGEARGGKLLVTDRKLEFRPHKFNVQLDRWSVRFPEIARVEAEGDRFLVLEVAGEAKPHWLVVMRAKEVAAQICDRTA